MMREPSSRARRTPAAVRIAIHAAVYAGAGLMLLPFAWMLITALKTDQESLDPSRLLPASPQWGNFTRAVQAARLDQFYLNSVAAAAITTLLAGAHNALAGFAFAKLRFAGRRSLFGIVLATMMLPAQVSFIFAYLIAQRLGFVNNVQALVVPFLASGFGIYYMRQAIVQVPDSLLEAARLDGMSELDVFWNVVRPTVQPAISALAIFTFVASWNSFFWPLIAIDSLDKKTLPLAVADLAGGQYIQSWPVRMAAATILVGPLIVVFLLMQRAFVRGVALTGVKE
jgi:multiple sugar transport system permease protein